MAAWNLPAMCSVHSLGALWGLFAVLGLQAATSVLLVLVGQRLDLVEQGACRLNLEEVKDPLHLVVADVDSSAHKM